MGLFDLGKRIWNVTRTQGKAMWDGVESELTEASPHWDKVKQNLRVQGAQLRYKVAVEVRSWLEEELDAHQSNWRTLLGRDPEVERAYKLLGLPYGTEITTVKQRWRNLLKESHPDRHMDDPAQHAIATHKSQHLTAAYHQITKAFDEGRL